MQWLIDLIIEAVSDYFGYHFRGDPTAFDFTIGDLTIDNAWHDLDLSSIIPEGVRAINMITNIRGTAAQVRVAFKRGGQVNDYNMCSIWTQKINVKIGGSFPIAVDENRIMQYKIANATINICGLCIAGWWF